jgi:hypothetical protein
MTVFGTALTALNQCSYILGQYLAADIKFSLNTFTEGAGNGFLWLTNMSHITNILFTEC